MKQLFLVLLFCAAQPVFGYDFKDMCRDIASSKESSKEILSAMRFFETIQLDSQAEGFIDFIVQGTDSDSFYLGDLYRSDFFRPLKDEYRGFTLKHVRNSQKNAIVVIPESYDDVDVGQVNDYMAVQEIGIRSNSIACLRKYRSFSVYYKSKDSWEHAGDLKPRNIADGMLKILEPSNVKKMSAQPCELFDDLDDETRVLMSDFCHTFPESSRLLDHYVDLNDFVSIETGKKNMITYTHVSFEPKVRRTLNKDYPDMAEYMDKYRKLITLSVAIKNKNGNTYVTLHITPKKTILEGYTYQGKVVPVDEEGNLVFEEAGTFQNEKEILSDTKLKVDFLGLDLSAHGKGIIKKQNTPKKEAYNLKVENITYKYSGRLLGIIPISVIKFLAPIDIDQFMNDMIYVMLHGNNNEGTILSIEWEEDDARNRFSKLHVSSEMLDHNMIEFITSIMRKFLRSKNLDQALAQSQALGEKVLSAVVSDARGVFSDLEGRSSGNVQLFGPLGK